MKMKKDSRGKYLIKNTAIFAIGNIGTKLISFFMVPLYTYAMSTEEYGTADMLMSVCAIAIPLIMCNIGESIRRYLLDKRPNERGIQATEIVWILIGTIIGLFLYIICLFIPSISHYSAYIALYTVGNAFATTSFEFLRGKEQLKLYTFCSLLQSFLIALLNIIFLVNLKLGIKGFFGAYIISYFFSAIIANIASGQMRFIRNAKFDKKLFIEMSQFSITLVPNSIMWWITNSSDRLMVTYFISAAANGIYTISYKLPTMMSTFNTILMQAWQYSAIKEEDSADEVEYNNKMFQVYVAMIGIIGAGILLINKTFINIYVAEEYRMAWKYTPFLVLGYAFSTMSTFVGTSYYVKKDMKGNLKSSVVGAIANIILNIILIPLLGISGAAIATCISYILVFVYRLKDTRKYIPIKTISVTTIEVVIILFGMMICSYIKRLIGTIGLIVGFICMTICTQKYWRTIFLNILRRK